MIAGLFAHMKEVDGSDWRDFYDGRRDLYDGSALYYYPPDQLDVYSLDEWWDEYQHELNNGYKVLDRQLEDAGW